jgi:hypothetical protein
MTTAPIAAPAPTAASPPASGPPPSIVPNRRRLDNRFPVLAFTIQTFGRPLFEILLATDRALFDPANAARRTPANFYAGRQDGGRSRATADDTAFVVPAAALRRFADARPRAGEIYFTVAAYATADGPPAFAQPVATLSTTAPSVLLGRDFAAHTLAQVLGVPSHKLAPATVVHEPPAYAPAMGLELDDDGLPVGEAQSWTSHADEAHELAAAAAAWGDDEPEALSLDAHDPDLDLDPTYPAAYASDDDAYGQAYSSDDYDEQVYESAATESGDHGAAYAAEDEDAPEEASHAYAADDEDEDEAYAQSYDDGYGYGDPDQPHAATNGGSRTYASDDDADDDATARAYDSDPDEEAAAHAYDYDDGYDTAGAGSAASALGGDASEPAMLADVDEDRLDQELAGAAAYDDESFAAPDPEHGYPHHNGGRNGRGNGVAAMAAPPFEVGSDSSRELDIPTQIAIITKIGRLFETPEGFRGINADTEFSTPNLPQHERWHVGLTYGLIGFTQDSGLLGQLLTIMRSRDSESFARIFGPDADELVRVTNLTGPSSRDMPGGRGARVQPVGGADLWTEPWLTRFRRAAEHPPFQAAQNQLAVQAFLYPMLAFAQGFGLDSERALAMVTDRAIHMGVGGARRWLTGAIGPVRTDAQRQQALSALRIGSLRDLQRANGVHVDGTFGPLTHAALVGALRRLGPASPIPIADRKQLMDAIVARADAEQAWWRQRPHALRWSPDLADEAMTWTTPPSAVR